MSLSITGTDITSAASNRLLGKSLLLHGIMGEYNTDRLPGSAPSYDDLLCLIDSRIVVTLPMSLMLEIHA